MLAELDRPFGRGVCSTAERGALSAVWPQILAIEMKQVEGDEASCPASA